MRIKLNRISEIAENLLLELASIVRELHLFEIGMNVLSPLIYGSPNFDWTKTVAEMFQRKLDTLSITTSDYAGGILSEHDLNELVKVNCDSMISSAF